MAALAIHVLASLGHLTPEEHDALDEGERLLRGAILAARLATPRGGLLPSSPTAVTVARAMGYRDRVERSALEGLLGDIARARDNARRAFRSVLARLAGC